MLFQDFIAPHKTGLENAIFRCGSIIPYPWINLHDIVSILPGKELPLIGYGSLLNKKSASKTIKSSSFLREPCILFGCRRVFNYEMPQKVRDRYGVPPDSLYRAALNVEVTRNPNHFLNGILAGVSLSDLSALCEREFGYDLAPVPYLIWEQRDFSKLSVAYVLTAPDTAALPAWQVVRNDILPEPGYANLCEQGARSISEEFVEFYLGTTFLANKSTTLKSLKKHTESYGLASKWF